MFNRLTHQRARRVQRSNLARVCAIAAIMVTLVSRLQAGNTWDGGGTTDNWSDNNNWSPDVPHSVSRVVESKRSTNRVF